MILITITIIIIIFRDKNYVVTSLQAPFNTFYWLLIHETTDRRWEWSVKLIYAQTEKSQVTEI